MMRWIARRLHFLADRICPEYAFRCMSGWAFTFEQRKGITFNEDGRGCKLWYHGPDYEKAHTEAQPDPYRWDRVPVRTDWWPPGVDGHAEVARIVDYLAKSCDAPPP